MAPVQLVHASTNILFTIRVLPGVCFHYLEGDFVETNRQIINGIFPQPFLWRGIVTAHLKWMISE